ncbi:MAG: HNH endonuclease [Dehalococcoidia bacterium]|nr:MAG: HNH endonuclease [Dehalococcoidia bacterium]
MKKRVKKAKVKVTTDIVEKNVEEPKTSKVLVLNRHWFPIDIVTYKDAFKLMCKTHAKAVETLQGSYMMHTMESWIDLHMDKDYQTVSTVSLEISVPEIIVLTDYDQMPVRFINFSKANLLTRDDYQCAYCGCEVDSDTATIDHIHPQSKGGKTDWENCTIACKNCNHAKADSLPTGEFKPRKKAKEPAQTSPIYQMNRRAKRMACPESWSKFLFT